jgi:hypothetical protein
MPPEERPDVMAIYPSWWPELARSFGRQIDAVRIEDNVICGAPEKVIYEADWSSLAAASAPREGAVDSIDVADLVDERAHGYAFPRPAAGWVIGAILQDGAGRARFDAGRIVPEGRAEEFSLARGTSKGPATLSLRTDGGGPSAIRVEVLRGDVVTFARAIDLPARDEAAWFEVSLAVPDAAGGDRVRVTAVRGAWRSFHAWLLRP